MELVRFVPPDAVEIRLTGACHGCPASSETLREGVERAIHAHCPEIIHIRQISKGPAKAAADGIQFISPLAANTDQGWTDAALLGEIPEGGVTERKIAGRSVLLSRRDGRVSCFDDACAHLGMPLEMGDVADGVLTYTYHGFRYLLETGECLTAPEVQLAMHAVRVRADRVAVRLEGYGMATALRISLQLALKHAAIPSSQTVLDRAGPLVCLGAAASLDGLAIPVVPSAATLFGPRGASLMGPRGPLWASDTGHHRQLGWAAVPTSDNTPADWVIGQSDFTCEGRNAKGQPGPATLNVPTGVTAVGDGMAVADAWNHRVLIWHTRPDRSDAPADVVLGQADFAAVEANAGAGSASARSLFWPYGVHWDGARLWVADSGNRRVLMWHGVPATNGRPADLVLGQRDFGLRDENGGGVPTLSSMRWPHGVTLWGGRQCARLDRTGGFSCQGRQPVGATEPGQPVLAVWRRGVGRAGRGRGFRQ